MEKGYLQIYTGNGKGKTTAAFGLAVRALCAGKNVFIGQFVKSMKYNETKIAKLFDSAENDFGKIEIRQYGRGCFIGRNPEDTDKALAAAGLAECAQSLKDGKWDVVILDELNIALHFGLIGEDEVRKALSARNPQTEIIITGRYAPQWLIDAADLVTEMQEVNHYYRNGVLSRNGIDR